MERTTQWRVIPLETMDAANAMAREESLVETISSGGPPTIRFWRWEPGVVTIGRFQDVHREVDVGRCRELDIDVVRRMSGGGAMYHQEGGEFAYSLTAPAALFPHDLVGTYTVVLGLVVNGLQVMDIDKVTVEDNSILIGGLKVSGNSQRRSRGVVQVHGTVLHHVDDDIMFSVLRARSASTVGRATPSRYRPVTGVTEHSSALMDETYLIVRTAMVHGLVHKEGPWTEDELAKADGLASTKYSSDEWNLVG